MTTALTIILTMLVASFVRGASGFGAALIAMPILSSITSVPEAAPLMALLGLTNDTLLSLYYRRALNWDTVLKLLAGSVLGIPVGFWLLNVVPASVALLALGGAIALYSIYALISPSLPVLRSQSWLYSTGFISGVLNGGYNLPGPPVILYGNSQKWSQNTFKSNLSGFFWFNAVLVVLGHGLQHRISTTTLQQYAIALPSLLIGTSTGIVLSKFFNPAIFQRVVLVILLVIGIQLCRTGLQT